MKKVVFALAVVFALSATSMKAQESDKATKRMDKTEMIQNHTDRMVRKYGLDENQAKKLFELNNEYSDKMFMGGGPRNIPGGVRKGMRPRRGGMRNDSTARRPRPNKEQMEIMMKQMTEARETYNSELKKIMTDEQYGQYEEDMKKMAQRRPERPRKED